MTLEIVTCSSDDWVRVAGEDARALFERCVERTGRCRVGLSGGSTPGAVFEWFRDHLSDDLERALWVTWVDERILALDAPERAGWRAYDERVSARLAHERWLDGSAVAPERILEMGRGAGLDEERARFRDAFVRDFDGGLDVALLGAGPDGHVASLFPGRSHEGDGLTVAVRDSPKPPPERLSLSMGVLAATAHVRVWARGASKREALRAASMNDDTSPLGEVSRQASDVAWIIDEDASWE